VPSQKVYVTEPMPVSFTGVIHHPRLKDRLATRFVPFAEFERDAAAGTLPDFSLIEPNMPCGMTGTRNFRTSPHNLATPL
jgi:phospholipase C